MEVAVKKPVITEKSLKMAKDGLYTFVVDNLARKQAIARAIEKLFNVKVIKVKTANLKDEIKLQRGRRGYFKKSGFRKATVQLKEGQKITLFEAQEGAKEEEKEQVKEKKSLLTGTKVKVERGGKK